MATVAAASQPRRKTSPIAAFLKLLSAAALATIVVSGPVSAQEAAAEAPAPGVRGPDIAVRRQVLMNNLGQIQAALATLDQRKPTLDELKAQVQQLIDEVSAIPTAHRPEAQKDEEKPKAGAKKIPFRQPLMQAAEKDPRGGFICENGRATVYDSNAADEGSQHFARQGNQLVRKEGSEHLGETLDEACQPGSAVMKALRKFDARKTYLQFIVYPDGYEVFLAVRSEARKLKFDVSWEPWAAGAAIPIGSGRGKKD